VTINHEMKVALVTAGAAGIGRAIAERLMGDGVQVHICDIDGDAIEAFTMQYPDSTATEVDVSESEQVDALFADIEKLYGRLDILVNNVGIAGPTAEVENVDPADWDRTIAVDLNSAFYVTRKAATMLKSRAGSIINMSSSAGLFGYPLRSPYVAAKWALIGLTKTWAMEMGPEGVRVNAICPGSVDGPRINQVIANDAKERGLSEDKIRDVYQRQSSLRTFVEPKDVANMVAFLCSDAGRHVSGQAIALDGHTEGLSNWLD
jgi:NAD(P)-dependent dehydrogenase (short-subunit alcohol dehydrogenase family)